MNKKVFGKGILVGVAMAVVNLVLNLIMNAVYPASKAIYENNTIFRPMTDPLMGLFWLYPIVLGLAFACIYDKTKTLYKEESVTKKGLKFSLMYLFIAAIPAFFINFSSFNLPFGIVISWTLMSYLNGLVAGLILAKLDNK